MTSVPARLARRSLQVIAGATVATIATAGLTTPAHADPLLPEVGGTITNLAGAPLGSMYVLAQKLDIDGDTLPHYKLYDREGKLLKKFFFDPKNVEGGFKHEDLEAAIKEFLAKPPAP